MATTHTPLPENIPGRYGEWVTADWLSQLPSKDLHLWFGVNYLEAVGDIDIVLGDPRCGLWAIEIKGFSLGQISAYSRDAVTYGSTDPRTEKHPGRKAHSEAQRLSSWLRKRVPKDELPWVHSVAWWPNIDRNEWIAAFNHSSEATRDVESMLFSDEMTSEAALFDFLAELAPNPMFGSPPPRAVFEQHARHASVITLLDAPAKQVSPIFPSILRPGAAKTTKEDFDEKRVRITGKPGTGKTVKLLEYGEYQLQRGRRVLYTSFNKTLPSEIRRELGSRSAQANAGEFLAMDIYQLVEYLIKGIEKYAQASGNPIPRSSEFEEYFRNGKKLIEAEGNLEKFDVVLIDEAQDFPDYGVELLETLAKPDAWWVVADGPGQELYPPYEPSRKLKAIMKDATVRTLRRNFRQSPQAYLVYQSFDLLLEKSNFETGRSAAHAKLSEWLGQIKKNSKAFDQLDFDFDLGEERAIISLDSPSTVIEGVKENVLAPMVANSGPTSALIIAPHRESKSMGEVRRFLTEKNLPFLDLVAEQNRRVDPSPTSIRLSTVHSARGLTADYVYVLDFDQICTWHGRGRQLATIALSRARVKTTVFAEQEASPYVALLGGLVSACEPVLK